MKTKTLTLLLAAILPSTALSDGFRGEEWGSTKPPRMTVERGSDTGVTCYVDPQESLQVGPVSLQEMQYCYSETYGLQGIKILAREEHKHGLLSLLEEKYGTMHKDNPYIDKYIFQSGEVMGQMKCHLRKCTVIIMGPGMRATVELHKEELRKMSKGAL